MCVRVYVNNISVCMYVCMYVRKYVCMHTYMRTKHEHEHVCEWTVNIPPSKTHLYPCVSRMFPG